MSKAGEERYVFEVEWNDQQASLVRKYLFTYFPSDKTLEMVSQLQMNLSEILSLKQNDVEQLITFACIVRLKDEKDLLEENGLCWCING